MSRDAVRRLRLRSESLGDLAPDELAALAGGAAPTLGTCLGCTRPTTITVTGICPTMPIDECAYTRDCLTVPVNDCLLSFGC